MPSDIDELLADLREREATIYQDAAYPGRGPCCKFAQASQIARWIAAAKELVAFKAAHEESRGHDVLCERHDCGD
ncbi:hypothetical protein LCGC14_2405240 [marine sediment metagenome]|uniref:Uncharacterized protein n=1 Tax=marine sediment metagenome TaxID=412755 RepID=A0A0F9ENJ3_9ZZZZ